MRLGSEAAGMPTDAYDEMEIEAFLNTPDESKVPRPEDRELPAVRDGKDARERELENSRHLRKDRPTKFPGRAQSLLMPQASQNFHADQAEKISERCPPTSSP
jgi:hypothetical protein